MSYVKEPPEEGIFTQMIKMSHREGIFTTVAGFG